MPAQTYGDVSFGLTDETGFYINSATFDFTSQEVWVSDAGGDDVAGAVFKQEATFTLEGAYKTSDSPTWTLGTALTIASLPDLTEWIPTYTSGALTIIMGGTVSLSSEELEARTITGTIKPFLGAAN